MHPRKIWNYPTIVVVLNIIFCFSYLSIERALAKQQPSDQSTLVEATINLPIYAARQARLLETCRDGIAIIPSQSQTRQGLRENLNFVYLTGLSAQEAVLVLDPAQSPHMILFWQQAVSPRGTVGGGPTPGSKERAELFSKNHDQTQINSLSSSLTRIQAHSPGEKPPQLQTQTQEQTRTQSQNPSGGQVNQGKREPSTSVEPAVIIKAMDELTPFLRALAGRAKRVYISFADLDFLVRGFGSAYPFLQSEAIFNLNPVLSAMRLTKDESEVQALRDAIDITVEALNETFRAAEPGMKEIDLAAILKYTFNRRDTRESFLQAASGPNSTNVHFGATTRIIQPGDVIVIDVGAYSRGYTSDITRTIPASGRFTKEQRTIYELVLAAQKEGCRRLISGVTFKAVQDEVEKILLRGLEKLGLVTDIDSWWQRRLYIQHGFGHGIGLEVHDSWSWHGPRLDKVVMVPGMVMTMEPGLYFPEKRLESFLASLEGKVPKEELAVFMAKVGPVYARYAGMGVRIEDDILITAEGNEILSAGVPKEVEDIEKIMQVKSPHNSLK